MAHVSKEQELADRIRRLIGNRPGVTSRRMFGGTCFMLDGHMVCCSMKPGTLLLRVGAEAHADVLSHASVQPMLMGGREMTGFVEVIDDIDSDDDLRSWVEAGWSFVTTLPPKPATPPRAPAKR